MVDAADLYRQLPHAGDMRLIEQIVNWDTDAIRCTATSHRDQNNPLRVDGLLPAICGIEYAAQAMAIHGVLNSSATKETSLNRERIFVVLVKNTICRVGSLDQHDDDLEICSKIAFRQNTAAIYDFAISASGTRLVDGQLGLMSPPRESRFSA